MSPKYSIVTEPTKQDELQWSRFVEEHPLGNVFQTPEMYHVYLNTNKYFPTIVLLKRDDEVIGSLLSVIQKEYKGILGKLSSRSIIWGGPLVMDNDSKHLDKILSAYNKVIRKKALYSQFRNLSDSSSSMSIFIDNKYTFEEHLDILIDLKKSSDDLVANMHKSRKRNAGKSARKGSSFKLIEDKESLKEVFGLIESTYKRINLPYPDYSLFESAFEFLHPKKKILVFASYIESNMIGVRIELVHKGLLYDWYAGSDYEERNKYPNDFLIFKILEWGQKNEFNSFDFGGAGKPGIPYSVRDHKLQFGGELVNFGRFNKIHNPLYYIAVLGFKILTFIKSKT